MGDIQYSRLGGDHCTTDRMDDMECTSHSYWNTSLWGIGWNNCHLATEKHEFDSVHMNAHPCTPHTNQSSSDTCCNSGKFHLDTSPRTLKCVPLDSACKCRSILGPPWHTPLHTGGGIWMGWTQQKLEWSVFQKQSIADNPDVLRFLT